ncbi:PAS domain-containing hybrid sensor histidine kinase/response regulator [Rhizobium sp. C4]|uniref:PAS domain-containing hybrid sensor histidine kinase/response regulator n=1 Tax=Rhizobium sp. C4 TaxID=1349800 RepID=UPI001E2F928D|nr:PAS-domain containing protein [Rhizobium sp. C4]MCD2173915.1 PAS-domain containing protein [Rhizobium sp. C4]
MDLLAMACQRLARTRVPACIKDSELRYVAVSSAFAGLHHLQPQDFIGLTDAELPNAAPATLRDEMERKAAVFGIEGDIVLSIGAVNRQQRLKIEQFVSETGDIFLYEHLEPAPPVVAVPPASWWDIAEPASETAAVEPSPVEAEETAFLSVLKNALSQIDAGILIVDPRDRVAFVNEKMIQLYRPYMGSIHAGESISDILMRGIQRGLNPDVDPSNAEACEQRLQLRLQAYRQPYYEDTYRLGTGSWVRLINRRLENGYVVGLRLDITDSKEREALLIKQRDEVSLYKAMLDALPVPVFVRDENHIMIYANEVERELLDARQLPALGSDEHAIFGDDVESYIEENDRVLATGEISVRESIMHHRSDRAAHILSHISRATVADGSRYIVGSLLDMTPLRERELELEQARNHAEAAWQQLSDIMNSIDTGVMVIRQDDLIIELANENVLRKWQGTELAGLVGCNFLDMLNASVDNGFFDLAPEQLDAAKEKWRTLLGSGELPLREFTTAAGEIYLIQGRPISSGRVVLTYNDITELRRQDLAINEARAKLAEAGALMEEALVTMAQGLVIIASSGDVRMCNSTVERLLEVPAGMIHVGGRWEHVFVHCAERGDFGPNPVAFLEEMQHYASSRVAHDVTFCVAEKRWIRLEIKPTDDGTIGLFTDVTELRGRQEELERLLRRAAKADRAKSDFLATVSHEFRTPMNGVLSMAELLARSDLDTRQKTYVNAITKSAKSLMTVINDILDFSKLDSGHLELHPVHFNPLECIDDTATILAAKAEEKSLAIVVSPTTDIPKRVFGDPLRFRQIVFNLVSNAIRFTDRGHVEIRLSAAPRVNGRRVLTIEVEDTGCGIAPEHQRLIFEASARSDTTRTGHTEGLGIGLPTNVGLVRLFGGTIELESEVGRGTTFRVALPLDCAEARNDEDEVLPAIGARVLLVDEIAASRHSIGSLLHGWQFDATGVESPDEAWAILEAAESAGLTIDVLVLSSTLARRGARKLVEKLHGDPRFAATSVVLMTPVLSDSLQGAAEIAADAQLQRPVRSSLLLGALCDVMAARRRGGPAVRRPANPMPAPEYHDDGAPVTIDVLVAEDNEVSALACEQILTGLGVSFRIARDGEEAVRFWEAYKPEIVIMDIMMPRMNGYEATAAIRAEEARSGRSRTPIIAITASTMEHDRNVCLDADMDDYLPKPFTPELLSAKVDIWRSLVAGEAKITDDFIRSA